MASVLKVLSCCSVDDPKSELKNPIFFLFRPISCLVFLLFFQPILQHHIKATFKAVWTYLLVLGFFFFFMLCFFPCFLSQARSPDPLPLCPKVSRCHSKSIKMVPLRRRACPPPSEQSPFLVPRRARPQGIWEHTWPFGQLWELLEDKSKICPGRS